MAQLPPGARGVYPGALVRRALGAPCLESVAVLRGGRIGRQNARPGMGLALNGGVGNKAWVKVGIHGLSRLRGAVCAVLISRRFHEAGTELLRSEMNTFLQLFLRPRHRPYAMLVRGL
ncbi:hypothetical protein D3C86_1558280 [compost metagenome]